MADDKKKAAPGGSGLFHKDHYKEVLYMLLPGLLFLSYILNRFFAYIDSLQYSAITSVWDRFFYALMHFWSIWKVVAAIASLAAVAVLIYSYRKLHEIEEEEEKIFGHNPEDTFLEEDAKKLENEKWVEIMAQAHSENPAEWRLAIIHADSMLEEMLKDLGYRGEGIGEMLKSVDPTDMLTLDKAWEAHKVRNRIAHAGQDFELSDRETRRVIGLFEDVFREFGII